MTITEEKGGKDEFVKTKYNPKQYNLKGDIYQVISVDLKGPFNIPGFKGERYLMAFIDSKASMQAELYFVREKKAKFTSEKLDHYLREIIIPNRKSLKIKYQFSIMHSDNGNEFKGEYIKVCRKYDLKQTFTVSHSPEQNAVVERYWRSLMGPTLAFMFSAKLDKRLWTYCCSFVNEIILNQLRIITYKGKITTTYEVITKQRPNIAELRTWGCEVYALDTRKYDPRHFTEKAFKGYFVGYDRPSKSSLAFDPLNDEVIMTCHIKFNEIVKGIRDINNVSLVNLNFQSVNPSKENDLDSQFFTEPFAYWNEDDDDTNEGEEHSLFLPENGTSIGHNHNDYKMFKGTKSYDEATGQAFSINISSDKIEDIEQRIVGNPLTLGSLRYEEDYSKEDFIIDTNLANKSFRELYDEDLEDNNKCFKAERRITVQEAINGPDSLLWREAIKTEYDGQDKLNSFSICIRPPNVRLLDWILIFKRKFDKGVVEKYKVRATVRGDKQVEDADYWDTYAPVGKLSSLRIFVVIVAYLKLLWVQVDYVTAFLQAEHDQNNLIHLSFPPEYEIQGAIDRLDKSDPIRKIPKSQWKEKLCLKMNKSIYGLKQAPKQWFEVLNKNLIIIGFIPLKYEPCIYIYTRDNGDKYFLFLYVDDTLIAGKDKEFIMELIRIIKTKHEIKVLGEPNVIIGLKLTRCVDGNILIDQNQYIRDVAKRFDITSISGNPVRMPCTVSQFRRIELEADDASLIDLTVDLRPMVGSLMYASLGTRPDITYFVNYISRYLTKPTKYIEKIVKQCIAYLLDTQFVFIVCFSNYTNVPQVTTMCDASHASESNRKATTGVEVKVGQTPVEWTSNKQSTFSLSTAESEYKALSDAAIMAVHVINLVQECGLKQILPSRVYEDNTATIAMTDNPIINKKSKHIEIRYHFIKDLVQRKILKLWYVATKYQEADILTKILPSFEAHYTIMEAIFQTNTIVTNQTKMIRVLNNQPIRNEREAERRSIKLCMLDQHLKDHSYEYVNSENYDEVNLTMNEERIRYTKELQDNMFFTIVELEQLSAVIIDYLTKQSKRYVDFFPNVFNIFIQPNNSNEITFIESMTKFHSEMETLSLIIYKIKVVTFILNEQDNYNHLQLRLQDFEEIISKSSYTNVCNMITDTNESQRIWLEKDELFNNQIKELNEMESTEEQKQIGYNFLKKQSLDKFKTHQEIERIKAEQEAKRIKSLRTYDEFLKIDLKYIKDMTNVENMKKKFPGLEKELIQQAQTSARKRFETQQSNLINTFDSAIPTHDLLIEVFDEAFKKHEPANENINKALQLTQVPINYQLNDEDIKEVHDKTSHQGNKVKRLIKNSDKIKDNDFIEPDEQISPKKRKMLASKARAFVDCVKRDN
jgi:hypothetical protein